MPLILPRRLLCEMLVIVMFVQVHYLNRGTGCSTVSSEFSPTSYGEKSQLFKMYNSEVISCL